MEMISIVLPIGLFIITLIIVLALRKADQNTRRLSNVKRLVDQIQAQTEKTDSNFKQELAEIEVAISQKEDKLHKLIETCTTQINTLDSYYEDFGRLGSAMQTYKTALAGVQKLTDSAQEGIDSVRADVDRLEEVRQLIESFRLDMQEAEKQLIEHEKAVIALEKETLAHMEDAASAARNDMESALSGFRNEMSILVDGHMERVEGAVSRLSTAVDSYLGELDAKVQATRDASDTLNERSLAILANMGDRAAEQLELSKQLEDLENRRAVLERQSESLDAQIREKAQVAAEMHELLEGMAMNGNASEPEPEPETDPEPEPESESEPEPEEFEIKDMDFDLDAREPEPEPEPEEKPGKKVEYTGEDEEIIFG